VKWVAPMAVFTAWTAVSVAGALDYRGFAQTLHRPGQRFWRGHFTPLWFSRLLYGIAAALGLFVLGVMITDMVRS
jgi:hypothetical protein